MDDEMLTLWRRARGYVLRYCRGTLSRLREGDGGFYDADDLLQDLYVEFHALVLRWRAGELTGDTAVTDDPLAALFTVWQRLLARGGWRIYRRAPQRLWVGAELAMSPGEVELEDDDSADHDFTPLPHAVQSQLAAFEDGARSCERLAHIQELEDALWRLRPGQRQALYLNTLEEMPAVEVARLLALPNPAAIYDRIYDARLLLAQEVGGGHR
ncbi:MAG: RNA polymerase sigma factor [Anaerolineae bacterium]